MSVKGGMLREVLHNSLNPKVGGPYLPGIVVEAQQQQQ